MAISFSQAKTLLLNQLGEDDTATDTFAGQCLDMAQRDVARAHNWPELYVRAFFVTSALYSTGTVAVTNTSATVTLTGGTWPSDVATGAYRFALSTGSQWYKVATRSSDSVILLAADGSGTGYVGATGTGLSYVVYKVIYTLPTAVDRIEGMVLHDGTRAVPLTQTPSEAWLTDFGLFPNGSGVPTRYMTVERDASGTVQVMLGPAAPDAVYRVECLYRRQITEGTFVLGEPLVDLVICRAQALLYARDHYQRYLAEMRLYREALRDEIYRSGDSEQPAITLGLGRAMGTHDYLERLLDYGTVEP